VSRPPFHLDQVQRWMQAVITHPHGVAAGVDSPAAREQIDLSRENVEQVVSSSSKQTSMQRLEVYANAYYARLLECLHEEFSALVHALGEETFDAFGFGYLQQYPSQSYTLAELGRHFPRYLSETRPPDTVNESGSGSWPDFLIDLATTERTYSEVFDGPGVEGKTLLAPEDLATIDPEQWPDTRLDPAPCLRLLLLRYPVHEYISSVRHGQTAEVPAPSPTYLVITRRDFIVRRVAVSSNEHAILQSLVAGETVGTAIEGALDATEPAGSLLASDLHRWFRTWAEAGYFQAVAGTKTVAGTANGDNAAAD